VRFAFIESDLAAAFPAGACCDALGVSRAGYYAWLARPQGVRAARRAELAERIRSVHAANRRVYGSPRVHAALASSGETACCVNTVAKVMRAEGIRAKTAKRFVPRTTDSTHQQPVAANVLDRRFDAALPDRKWAADITYVPTGEGWLYLAGVIDLCSRRVVGWSMADHMRTDLVADALGMALAGRSPAPGLLHHSDRGSQYASDDYQRLLAGHGLACSMSGRGDCWDNAVVESFWGTLKAELVDGANYATRDEARASIFEYIEVFYNRERLHSSLGYLSPEQFEAGLN
jgi:transposase InsO family protein